MANLISINALFKDMYPCPGDRIKQWVVDERRQDEWMMETCPRVDVGAHDDNTGAMCRHVGPTPWFWLAHDCCGICNELYDVAERFSAVMEWRDKHIDYVLQHPIEQDRTKLSDEIAPDLTLSDHPLLVELRKAREEELRENPIPPCPPCPDCSHKHRLSTCALCDCQNTGWR